VTDVERSFIPSEWCSDFAAPCATTSFTRRKRDKHWRIGERCSANNIFPSDLDADTGIDTEMMKAAIKADDDLKAGRRNTVEMSESELRAAIAEAETSLSETYANGARGWELESRLFRLRSELAFIENGGRDADNVA
jgi:hypothetical protein